MGKKPKNIVNFLAYLTTGPLPDEDGILETAFVRVKDGQETEFKTFLANPGQIPVTTKKLTGLDEKRLAGKKGPRKTVEQTLSELGDGPVVVHDAEVFMQFLDALYLPPPEQIYDSRELAQIILPECRDFSLTSIAQKLDIAPANMYRGLDLARLTRSVWEGLVMQTEEQPGQVAAALKKLADMAETPLAWVFAKAANRQLGFELSNGSTPGLETVIKDHTDIYEQAQQYEKPEPGEEHLNTEKICAMLEKNGAVGRHLKNFEPRREQISMTEKVCEALNHAMHMMCEAGTGTGKSMAYLLPAIAWACQNDDKVIVSTNTKNLQEQLYDKELPFLKELLGDRFRTAILKGRSNYLCVRKLLNVLQYCERELSGPEEAASLLPVISWASSTKNGDMSECSGFMAQNRAYALKPMVTATGDECRGRACRFINKCFVKRARTLAQLSDIIVVNHALAFADVALDMPHLPDCRCFVFDEAHNIEDVATGASTVASDGLAFYRICRRLWRKGKDGAGSGLVSTLMGLINKHLPAKGALSRETALDMAQGVVEAIEELGDNVRCFFDLLSEPFDRLPAREDKIMLNDCRPTIDKKGRLGEEAAQLAEACRKLRKRCKNLSECLRANEKHFGKAGEFAQDLEGQSNRVEEAINDLEFILEREDENYVYWLERTRSGKRTFYALKAAPLEIGPFMRTFFFDEMRSVILTSATLRVEKKFDYVKERLGANHLTEEQFMCMAFGSPFNFTQQTRLCVPTFLPDAGGRRDMSYDEELSSFLIDLLRGTTGRSLVLFTSYSLLDTVYERIKRPLERVNIPLLAQGKDGSRRVMTALFKENVGSVLLGTQSFWEGVDVLGESLSCLVLTKLPFHVFTDPLVQGRIQHLRECNIDPFRHYTLPQAVINFRQGFGRLIRHRSDRGVVVVTDRRLVTKTYGRSFLGDIPTTHRVYKHKGPLIKDVKHFLDT